MSERIFAFDLQQFADELPPIGDDKDLAPLSDDFDAVLAADQETARNRPLDAFASKPGEDEDDGIVAPATDATSTEDLQAAAVAAKRDTTPDPALEEPEDTDVTAAPAAVEKPAATPVAERPAEAAPTEPPAAPAAAPTAPIAQTFADDEAVALSPTSTMTRKELNARLGFTDVAVTEANTFREIFGVTADDAKATWKPIIDGIRNDPTRAEFFDNMAAAVEDPGKRAYIEKALSYYEQQRAAGAAEAQPAAPVAAPRDPRVDQLLADKAARDARDLAQQQQAQRAQLEAAGIAIEAEKASLRQKWPQLADAGLMQYVAINAINRLNGDPARGVKPDPTYTLTRAAHDLQAQIEKFGAPAVAAAVAAAPTPAAVPALNGSGGASPRGSRRATQDAPPPGTSPDDALEHWIEHGGKAFE